MNLLKNVFQPVVVDQRGFRRYVVSVTLLSWLVALGFDIPQQILFAAAWSDCWREWATTTAVVIAIAVPIARSMGRAHLALHHAKQEAERLGRTDPLTGLANRRAFYEAAALREGAALALVIVDIDRFKRVNDRYGHMAGDAIIKSVARRMQAELGEIGIVTRLGGEEFALLSADPDFGLLQRKLAQFRARVAEEVTKIGDQSLRVTVSIGVAASHAADFDALYGAADQALYAAKAGGRDRIVDYDQIASLTPSPPDLARAS